MSTMERMAPWFKWRSVWIFRPPHFSYFELYIFRVVITDTMLYLRINYWSNSWPFPTLFESLNLEYVSINSVDWPVVAGGICWRWIILLRWRFISMNRKVFWYLISHKKQIFLLDSRNFENTRNIWIGVRLITLILVHDRLSWWRITVSAI